MQLQLNPELIWQLGKLALERGQSIAGLVVELLTQIASELTGEPAHRKAFPRCQSSAESGKPDLGVNIDEYLFKTLNRA